MSVVQHPDAMNAPNLQIWNNAAFDNGDCEDPSASAAMKVSSWSPLKPLFVNPSESLESDSSKENQSPAMRKFSVPCKALAPVKFVHQTGATGNFQLKPIKSILKPLNSENDENVQDENDIDAEIEEIEMEISRLSLRLKALRLEKAERNVKTVERRGRIIPAKFLEQNPKLGLKDFGELKRTEEPMSISKKTPRRAISMGPSEILAGVRKGRISVGPSEIASSGRTQMIKKPEITPGPQTQNRRKSCFWKLEDIDEKKVMNERGKSLSLSPKSRKTIASKIQNAKQAATATVGGRKHFKKEETILSSIQPKKLFKDCDKMGSSNKPLRSGRVVASRYNQITQCNAGSAIRKRSFPENGKEGATIDKRRAMSMGKSGGDLGSESRVKKKWEIPSTLVIHKGSEEDCDSVSSILEEPDLLPRIRTGKFDFGSPRDSGPAKRVSELIWRKPFFSVDDDNEEEGITVCQALDFAEAAEEI